MNRPGCLKSTTHILVTGLGKLYLTIGYYPGTENTPYEVFGIIGHTDPCAKSELEAICRLISLALRLGATLDVIADQLRNIKCNHMLLRSPEKGGTISSLADGVAKLCLQEFNSGKGKEA